MSNPVSLVRTVGRYYYLTLALENKVIEFPVINGEPFPPNPQTIPDYLTCTGQVVTVATATTTNNDPR